VDLKDFSIEHDKKYVLLMLKQILKKKNLELLACPWSPPKCMKIGKRLKPWCYKKYANYIKKWLDAYADEGVKIKYITPQNEPFANQIWESCLYSYRAQRKLTYKYLANIDNVQILMWDHNKKHLSRVADELIRDNKKVAGLCFHWYEGTFADEMWKVKQKYPDTLLISSEMSCGFSPYDTEAWQKDANYYLKELFHDINSGTSAFVDWNMLLDFNGGPTYCKNYLKSPIILNETGDDFIVTPIYEALHKFAKEFPAGSEVVRCEYDSKDFVAIAKKEKNGYRVVIANLSSKPQEIIIRYSHREIPVTLPGGDGPTAIRI
jgi:glucosylceramidase